MKHRIPQDVSVIGAGPNGLAAAIRLAQAGLAVRVVEAASEIGGGLRSDRDSLKGYVIDHCASVFPLAAASPFFTELPLEQHGLRWLNPAVPLAHPFDDGPAAILHKSLDDTASTLGPDGPAWRALFDPTVRDLPSLLPSILGPPRPGPDPVAAIRFAGLGFLPATTLAGRFTTRAARGLFAGHAAHAFLRLDRPLSGAIGLLLGALAHEVGWPLAAGGAFRLAEALGGVLADLGGRVETDITVTSLHQLGRPGLTLLDIDPMQSSTICEGELPQRFRRTWERFPFGPGSFKVDFVLDGPVPWLDPECANAGTLHLGGSFEEIAFAEAEVLAGRCPERPFLIAGQPTVADPGRAPAGKHLFWAYCHVPRGASFDMTGRIEAQIARFAPGFRDRIEHRIVTSPSAFEVFNPAFPGGSIGGLLPSIRTTLGSANPARSPYSTPNPGIYLCSSATPPGGGVHGMAGYHAAESALRRFRVR